MTIDTDALKARTNIVSVIGSYVALKKRGPEYVGLCPFHNDTNPSFWVQPIKQFCYCFSCGASHDVIGFVQEIEGITFQQACEKLGATNDWTPRVPIKQETKLQERITSKPPPGEPAPDMTLHKIGPPIRIYDLRDADGSVLGYEARYAGEEGKKEIRVWTWGARGKEAPGWACGHFNTPRPLYGLERLAARPEAPVSVFEGPKKADAGRDLLKQYVCVSWTGGANAWHKHDWTPLRGRKVLLWPDADAPGRECCEKLAELLSDATGLACSVRIVGTDGMPEGWDVADAQAEGWDTVKLIEWAKPRARDYAPPPPPPPPRPPAAADVPEPTPKRKRPRLAVVAGNAELAPDPDAAELPQALSEDHLADAFAEKYAEDWRYVKRWDKWFRWDGGGWVEDDTAEAFHLARGLCRSAAYWQDALVLTPTAKRALGNKRVAGNVRDMAGTDRRLAATSEQWDTDPWLLGVPEGVIDLREGKFLEADREHYITKRTSVSPKAGPHPLWDKILSRCTRGDATMTHYLAKWAGYMTTGDTREEAFLFVHGPGGSGKSTFVQVIRDCLGSYAKATRIETFMSTRHGEHPTEIADLAGARLVSAPETEEGSRWNEGRIKMLTGRDKVKARFMGQDYFEFEPVCKIMIFGNHRPRLHSVGEEMKRRIHLVEFPDSIPAEEREPGLKLEIRNEYPAILAWMLDGCIAWQSEGLGRPEAVSTATDEYLASQDTMGAWLEECCDRKSGARCKVSDAYRSFEQWAKERGEYVSSVTAFSEKVQSRGIVKHKASVMYFIGIELKDFRTQIPAYGNN